MPDTGGGDQRPCLFCGAPGLPCPACGEAFACSPQHLRLHRREEDGECFPWKVEEREGVGRLMVTTRPIAAGEVIFREEPVVSGPSQTSSLLCLSCYSPCSAQGFRCPSCRFPMCDLDCAQSEVHRQECEVLARAEDPNWDAEGDTEAYHCVLPLRLLILQRSHPDQAALTDRLMDHEEERRGSDDWHTTERTVIERLCRADPSFSPDLVRRALGVLEVNCYEVINRGGAGMRACFPIGSLLSHCCVANSTHVWKEEPPWTNTCIATVDLAAGEEVLTSYQQPTMCTLRRRSELAAGWYFSCTCHRCLDPTELGSHMNTLVCPDCALPTLLPRPGSPPERELQLQTVKAHEEEWNCPCGQSLSSAKVRIIVDNLLEKVKSLATTDRYNIPAWLALEEEVGRVVHPQHEVSCELAKWLVPILVRAPGTPTNSFPDHQVRLKLDLAQALLAVLKIVEPGYSKSRVKALYEVTETQLHLGMQLSSFSTTDQICEETDNVSPNKEKISALLSSSISAFEEVVRVLDRLGANKGFEQVMRTAAANAAERCRIIQKQGRVGGKGKERLKIAEGWNLLDLVRWTRPA